MRNTSQALTYLIFIPLDEEIEAQKSDKSYTVRTVECVKFLILQPKLYHRYVKSNYDLPNIL